MQRRLRWKGRGGRVRRGEVRRGEERKAVRVRDVRGARASMGGRIRWWWLMSK